MTPATIGLIGLSALFHAVWNLCAKSSRSTPIFFFWLSLFTLIVTAIVFLIRAPIIPWTIWGYIGVSGVVHFAYWYSLSRAYTIGEISFVYPIARSAPAFVAGFAMLFFGETLSILGLIGIFCVLLSIHLFHHRAGERKVRSFVRHLGKSDSIWAFATLGTVISYSLIDKQGMAQFRLHSSEAGSWCSLMYYLTEGSVSAVFYGVYTLFQCTWRRIADIGRLEWRKIVLAGPLATVGYTIILYLFMTEKVSYVVALRQCSIIFAVFFGGYILKESRSRLRIAAAILMVFGMFLIAGAE